MNVAHATPYHWTVDDYEKLGEAGIFAEDERVELLNGEIVLMSPIGYRHAMAVTRLNEFFASRADKRYSVGVQNPLLLDEMSEPQPDLCLFDRSVDGLGRHPKPGEIFLVIEVSDSTLRYDRDDKRPAYARNKVREFWLVDLTENSIEAYREPRGDQYQSARKLGPNDTIAPFAFPDLQARVGDFLP